MGSLGAMQDFPLRIMRLMDHAEREHGTREIVAARPDGTMIRTNWIEVARESRRLAQALERLGVKPGERVATLAMNHDRHLIAWFGVVGMGGVLHTLNPRLFDDQLVYIINHAEDQVIIYDRAFEALVERLKPRLTSTRHFICFDDEFDALLVADVVLRHGMGPLVDAGEERVGSDAHVGAHAVEGFLTGPQPLKLGSAAFRGGRR